MAIIHGKNGQVYFHHTGFGSVGLHQKGNEATFAFDAPAADVTTFGSVARSFVIGQYSSKFDMRGFVDSAEGTTNPDGAFATAIMSGTAGTIWFMPEGTATGRPIYKINAFVTTYSTTSNLSGGVSYSASFQPSGTVVRETGA